MPSSSRRNSIVACEKTSPEDLLASILSSFGKPAKGEKRTGGDRRSVPVQKPLPLPLAYAEDKTGYRIWRAQARVVMLEEQVCACCGGKVIAVKDELFRLDNKTAHSTWLRHEGYGIEEPENLPVEFQHLPPRLVTACGTCASDALDGAILQLFTPQLSLPL